MLVLDIDPEARAHLARALAGHRRWCQTNGYTWPAGLECFRVALSGQERPDIDGSAEVAHDADVLLAPGVLTYAHAGSYLDGMSERTIRRLVDEGELPVVEIGRSRRIARADLEAFVARQRRGGEAYHRSSDNSTTVVTGGSDHETPEMNGHPA